MRRTLLIGNVAAFYDFVDNNFLNNKRPAIPGGAWPLESLRQKSLGDLQQIWFQLVKERNMLSTVKEHYLKHQEELGAMPAPSRVKMVEESMANLKQVVKERDAAATREAARIFKERLEKGIYRYPPGPPPPPAAHDPTSCIRLSLSTRVEPERLRELLGRFDVFEPHKGIVSIRLELPEKVLQAKREAEQVWQQYQTEVSDVREYHKWKYAQSTSTTSSNGSGSDDAEKTSARAAVAPSLYDYSAVELAPGVFASEEAHVVVASTEPVPAPMRSAPPPRNALDHIKHQNQSYLNKAVIQLGYFPNITMEPPRYERVEEVPRPTHPDEIEGPWEAFITYDRKDGLAYVKSLGLSRIDGAEVLEVHDVSVAKPFAAVDPVYQEAVRREMAEEETQMQWPHVPTWKYDYKTWTRKSVAEIVQYNYSNVVDYVDREVLLTGRSVWESPIDIDPTCGGAKSVPAHAKPPKRYMTPGIVEVGANDI